MFEFEKTKSKLNNTINNRQLISEEMIAKCVGVESESQRRGRQLSFKTKCILSLVLISKWKQNTKIKEIK